MKTHPVTTTDGSRAFAFEVENAYIAPAAAASLLAEVDGVTDVRVRRLLSKSSDIHVEFRYRGKPYIVWEPFGDHSRYWIGPKDEGSGVGEISKLEAAFERYRPPLHRVLFGDLVSLRFITRLFGRGP